VLCAYLDETGNTGSNIHDPLQRFHYVGAVVTPEPKWEAVRDDLSGIARDALGKKKARSSNFEFHGNQLFSGNGPWVDLPERDDRLMVYGLCLDLLVKHRLLFTYARCDKRALRRYAKPMHPHEISFWLALERIGIICKDRDSLGFIVADEGGRSIKQIARKVLNEYRLAGPPFGRPVDITKIIDTVHFMNSAESPHLQLCDLSLWAIQRFKAAVSAGTEIPERDDDVPTLRDLYRKVSARMSGSATFPY
jgi:hypothetical protein